MATACSTSLSRSRISAGSGRGHARVGRDLLYISQPGAPSSWVVWDGRDYVWIGSD